MNSNIEGEGEGEGFSEPVNIRMYTCTRACVCVCMYSCVQLVCGCILCKCNDRSRWQTGSSGFIVFISSSYMVTVMCRESVLDWLFVSTTCTETRASVSDGIAAKFIYWCITTNPWCAMQLNHSMYERICVCILHTNVVYWWYWFKLYSHARM